MATTKTSQVHPDSLDTQGLSVATASKDPDDPRYGMVYSPASFAAGVPVFFHDLGNGRYLGLYSRYWYAGTGSEDSPGYYGSHSTVTDPSWVTITAATGVANAPAPIPSNLSGTRTLEAACSRSDVLWVLNTLAGSALVQVFHKRGETGNLVLQSEEIVPSIEVDSQTVTFNRGVYLDAPHLMFFGSGSVDGGVYVARRQWARVGSTNYTEAPWEYQSDRGWSSDPADAETIRKSTGGILTTVGPMSAALYRDRKFFTTVVGSGSNRTGLLHVSRGLQTPWRQIGSSFLGAVGTTYAGGGLYLQGQLVASPTLSVLENPSNATAFLAVSSLLSTVSSEEAILNTWSSWPVSRIA